MSLRELTEDDLELILPWRNAPAVRWVMFHHHEISLEEHREWYRGLKNDQSRRWYLYKDPEGQPQGVVYFTDISPSQATAFWGFYAKPGAPPGTGMSIFIEALDLAFDELAIYKLSSEVLSDNERSIRLHKKAGFQEEGRFRAQHWNGDQRLDVIRLGLLKREWDQHRADLNGRVLQLAQMPTPPQQAVIVILSDHGSWLNDYLFDLQMEWETQGHRVIWAHETASAERELAAVEAATQDPSDPSLRLCYCLSFGSIVSNKFRSRFDHTLVVHESDLPRGKGWSPLTWQILEGQNRIPVTLIEAADQVDSGVIYAQQWLEFQGHELIDELRLEQARATHSLCRWFVDSYPRGVAAAKEQKGQSTFYARRNPSDSRLNPDTSLADQFDLLRIVDNDRYPAFFEHHGQRYIIAVTKS